MQKGTTQDRSMKKRGWGLVALVITLPLVMEIVWGLWLFKQSCSLRELSRQNGIQCRSIRALAARRSETPRTAPAVDDTADARSP